MSKYAESLDASRPPEHKEFSQNLRTKVLAHFGSDVVTDQRGDHRAGEREAEVVRTEVTKLLGNVPKLQKLILSIFKMKMPDEKKKEVILFALFHMLALQCVKCNKSYTIGRAITVFKVRLLLSFTSFEEH
jgi:hypothetical protein